MPSKKKKYNARFPAGRIKKIMQSDEEVGKVAQAVPIIISRTLELFVESLLTKTLKITNSRNAKTLSTSHMKQCIMSEQRFDFLRELVRNIPDISVAEEAANYNEEDNHSSPEEPYADSDTPYDLSMPSTSSSRHVQQYQQHAPTNGQNGGYDYPKTFLKRSISSSSNSVIMHTTSSLASAGGGYTATDCLPPKLSRSESASVPVQHHSPSASLQHPRLKHQSYSMPSNCVATNNNKPNIPPKPLRSPSQPTAIIPAPILSIDYCSKPMVKIDYSNLQQITADATAPLSAPAHIASMSANKTAFNFTAEPVINIDLSNIVAASATNAASAPSTPAVATISIGTPLPNNSSQQSRNSKASMADPFNVSPSPSTMTTSLASSSSCLELDEDYDNI
ncbi:dr1-associated corepressor homolog isoform X2 [Stomoxys calcitrans]|uniref:Transcription factor CBF/NF-Y/archaeal histone domain-containing protein n=1 Tax=Stomoxys calcitrans TaxID=35570 RepID=A0A1I8NWK8_STOCA|nr:dr1-associated corepressor homolog isoform X2 [Stomoxys calcitrans]